jgi:hypothetical protein
VGGGFKDCCFQEVSDSGEAGGTRDFDQFKDLRDDVCGCPRTLCDSPVTRFAWPRLDSRVIFDWATHAKSSATVRLEIAVAT